MKLNKIVVVVLLSLIAVVAFSQQRNSENERLNAQTLLAYCESDTVTPTGTWCLGYILGVWHSTAARREACPPADITSGEMRHAVVRHLASVSANTNRDPVDLVQDALADAFPCG